MIYNIRSMQQYVKQKMQTRDFYCKEVNTKCKKAKTTRICFGNK